MTARILLSVLFAASASAFAADNGSQYQWQTPVDKIEVTPQLGYMSNNSKAKSGIKTDTTGLFESVRAEYGLTEMWSAGLILTNSNLSIKPSTGTKTSQSGLMDPVVFMHGRSAMGSGSLRYGADVGFSMGKNKIESNGDKNNATGGISLAPFVGYEMYSAPCTYGARLSYKMFVGDRSQDANGTAKKIEGPNTTTLAFFMEHDMKPTILGAALEFNSDSKTTTKTNGTGVKNGDGYTSWDLALYVPYEMTETAMLLPTFTYGQYSAFDKTTIDSVSFWQLDVGARFAF